VVSAFEYQALGANRISNFSDMGHVLHPMEENDYLHQTPSLTV
jgi:hypothetical protein